MDACGTAWDNSIAGTGRIQSPTNAPMGRLTGMSCRAGAEVHIIKSDQPPPEHIDARVLAAQAAGEPVISVDTQEEGVGGQLQEQRNGLSPQGRDGLRQGARFRGQDFWAKWRTKEFTTSPPTRLG
jgi:hypothetical protein